LGQRKIGSLHSIFDFLNRDSENRGLLDRSGRRPER
jgi:hypothetical protein